jgi:hypothetical protein
MVACKIAAAKDHNGKLREVTFGNGYPSRRLCSSNLAASIILTKPGESKPVH